MQDRRALRGVDTDRRTAPRIPFRCEVDFLVSGVTYSAMAENLSLQGVFVATEVAVFDGLQADCSLYLGEAHDPIKIVGSAVRVARRRDERPGFAVEFGSISEETRARIRESIESN
jgi:hypothetical protein